MSVFVVGLLFGLSIAAPVGPMALLSISRTLQQGWAFGIATGLGIATGDAFYGTLAGFGFSAATNLLISYAGPLRVVGGLFLVWLGVSFWRKADQPPEARAQRRQYGLGRSYLVAVGLTLTNPATILIFIAAFSALDLAGRTGGGTWLVAGVFLGSAGWWIGLCSVIALLRRALTPTLMRWIDRLSAAVLVGFGAAAAAGLL